MICLSHLQFSYPGRPLYTDLSLSVTAGEILGILGPNGCGKTTLLRLMRGLERPVSGDILLQGRSLATMRRKEVARQIAVVPQTETVEFGFTVADYVAMGRYPWKPGWFGQAADSGQVQAALTETDTLALAAQSVQTLSGGELQRVLLARALVQQAPILLLDEASSHLDLDHRVSFARLLKRLNQKQGTTVIQVSHDLDLSAALCDRVLLLDRKGEVAALGTPFEVYREDLFRSVFGVEATIDLHPESGLPRVSLHLSG